METEKRLQMEGENPAGLFHKYEIRKVVQKKRKGLLGNETYYGTKAVDKDAEYFILRLDKGGDAEHVTACRIAVNAYADAIEHYLPQLASDLRKRYPITNGN